CAFLQSELGQTKGELSILRDLGQKDRAGNAVFQRTSIGTASGLSYLRPDSKPLRVIRSARAALQKSAILLPDWDATTPEHPNTNEILRFGRGVGVALRAVPEAVDVLRDAQAFLDRKNIALIQRWGQRSQTPFV